MVQRFQKKKNKEEEMGCIFINIWHRRNRLVFDKFDSPSSITHSSWQQRMNWRLVFLLVLMTANEKASVSATIEEAEPGQRVIQWQKPENKVNKANWDSEGKKMGADVVTRLQMAIYLHHCVCHSSL